MINNANYASLRHFDETDNSSVTAVKMLIENQVNDGKVILIVEGDDDREVYGRFVDSGMVEIYADGDCDKHSEILQALNPHYPKRLVAIKDADFDHLNGKVYSCENMCLTDFHDLECMILAAGIPESVMEKYGERMQEFTVDDVMHDLEKASYLKWYSSRQEHNKLRFKGLKWRDFYGENYIVAMEELFEKAKANTNNVITWTLADVCGFIQQNLNQDLKQLCRGHDVFECLYIRFKYAAPKQNFPKKKFFRDLRDSYTMDDFSKTNLYASLKRLKIVA